MARRFKVGVMVECLRMGLDAALEQVAAMGAEGVQIWCVKGPTAPENMDKRAADALNRRIESLHLQFVSLCGDLGKGFLNTNPAVNAEVIAKTEAQIRLAQRLYVTVITTHFGSLPTDRNDPRWRIGVETCRRLGDYALRNTVALAGETGGEDGGTLRRFIEEVDHPAIGVNFDPANLIMRGFDVMDAVRQLGPYIIHTHAKDALLGDGEVPIGQGDVDFPAWIDALNEAGYRGFLTIEREAGEDPLADISGAVRYLRSLRD